MAGDGVGVRRHLHGRALVVANLPDLSRTTGAERASLRWVQDARQVAFEHDLALGDLRVGDRHRGEQGLGVRVVRRREESLGRTTLHDLAEVHHDDAVGEITHNAQVVADEEQRRLVLALDLHQQFRHRRRDRHVEGRYRFVGDHHRRVPGECTRDADALLLAARELAWAPDVEVARQLDDVEELEHTFLDLRLVRFDPELLDDPSDLGSDGVARVEGVERVLEHHLKRADLPRRAIANRDLRDLVAVVADRSVRRGLESHEHFREGRFPAARFADDGDGLPAPGVETDLLVRFDVPHAPALDERLDRTVMDFVILLHVLHREDLVADLHRVLRLAVRDLRAVVDLLPPHAAYPVVAHRRARHRLDRDVFRIASPVLEEIAAGTEIAAARSLVRERKLAGDRLERGRVLVRGGERDAAEQSVGVGMLRPREQRVDRAFLDHLAGVHDEHPVADLQDEAEVVRDVDLRGAVLAADVGDELGDAGFDGDVERRRRLVEEEQRRIREQRHRDDHALLLAAGDLVRVRCHDPLRIGEPDVGEHL